MRTSVLILLALAAFAAADSEPNTNCDQDQSDICHRLAYCEKTLDPTAIPTGSDFVAAGVVKPSENDDFDCSCPSGVLGHGYGANGCTTSGWNVRVVYKNTTSIDESNHFALMGIDSCGAADGTRGTTTGCDHIHYTEHGDDLGVNVLFAKTAAGKEAAELAAKTFNDNAPTAARRSGSYPAAVDPDVGARVYRWAAGTTSDPYPVAPAGMEVLNVVFEPSCASSGCWRIDVDFTVGHSDVDIDGVVKGYNTFYLPYAVGSDELSYDFDYPTSVDDSYESRNFPCRISDKTGSNTATTSAHTMCCFGEPFTTSAGTGFLGNYRPTKTFEEWADEYGANPDCMELKPDQNNPTEEEEMGFLSGTFTGLTDSPGFTSLEVQDAFVGMYKASIKIDEVELRNLAGILKGTVGVEHTVDFFLGYVNFKSATGTVVLDSLAAQTDIHVEKTSFFTVSTHGTNDYTFLEYVNMRLVAIYLEDSDFSGADESLNRTVRTSKTAQAHYVQVTFTLGSQYTINENSGLIPSDSVRAGKGIFFDDDALVHKCLEWEDEEVQGDGDKFDTFEDRLDQDCAPAASMCVSPESIPDHFVSYNIPLGIDFYGDAASDLSNNVFVDMVISAKDSEATGTPNNGDDPQQMKTTLTASIPVVAGGINIFCDGFTAKTDLNDVVKVDIVVGSASDSDELTRLRIKKDIANTQLAPEDITEINSDSIESGLMTLVIQGDSSYFGVGDTNTGRMDVTVELEDVVTIHIMQDDGQGEDASVVDEVMSLITSAPADNTDSNGLITEGYALNGAFGFELDRKAQRAHLTILDDLLDICAFNPTPPQVGSSPLETCIIRRDVRYRQYPWRTGAMSTAMEICANPGTSADESDCPETSEWETSDESAFFVTIFGNSEYAKKLAVSYANVIDAEYDLNGRYRRAYWINPGYEWTPTQTGGTSIFSVSQKLFMFALVTLDEGLTPGTDEKTIGPDGGPELPVIGDRRRMLLQSSSDALKAGQSGVGGEVLQFDTSPAKLMAKAFEVPEDRVATFSLNMQLTASQACMSNTELQDSLRGILDDYLSTAASGYHTVQVTGLSVDKAGVQCRRALSRKLLEEFSAATATVKMLVVFEKGDASVISLAKLLTMPGINSITPLTVSPLVDTTAPADWSAPKNKEDGGSDNTAVIAGAVGGGVGALLIAGGAFMMMKRRSAEAPVTAVQTINVNDLKAQLGPDV